jgi:hypothetical protein
MDSDRYFVVKQLIILVKTEIDLYWPLRAFAPHHIFCVLVAPLPRYYAAHEAEGGHPMTFIKPLNIAAVCAAFVFIGAIVFGVL